MSQRDSEFIEFAAARTASLGALARALTYDAAAAEDLVQTTLVKVYLAWPRVRQQGDPGAYARRVLANAFVDERRRPWRRERSVSAVPDRQHDPYQQVDNRDGVVRALRTLPPGQRAVIALRLLEDLSVEDTAATLGLSTGTVKSQQSKGLAALRQALQDNTHERTEQR